MFQLNIDIPKLLKKRVSKFLVTGTAGALINLAAMFLIVRIFKMTSAIQSNIANLLSIEVSIWFSFIMNRNWTWSERPLFSNLKLVKQFMVFHIAVGASVLFRAGLYPLLQLTGMYYLVNSAIGIALGSIINYFFFDKLIFIGHNSTIEREET